MRGNEVKSSKWSDASVVFDNGEFSAVWGRYDNGKRKVLGLRWNYGEGEIGFPSSSGHPTWFVVPSEITGAVLASLLERVYKGGPSIGEADTLALAYKDYSQQIPRREPMLAVALYAAANNGKTKTLNALIRLLLEAKGEMLEEIKLGGEDRQVVLNYDGRIVGVGTGRDLGEAVKENFAFFKKHGCDIVFCATRKRSDSSSWEAFWNDTAEMGIRHEAVEKDYAPVGATEAEQETVNTNQARCLMETFL